MAARNKENLFFQRAWLPCSQMKDYKSLPPLKIKKARGPFLYTEDGRRVIDAISSWWCKSLGHGHPRVARAVKTQMARFEHIIGANTENPLLTGLSEMLVSLAPGFDRVFYAGDGTTAVEIAMKMSVQHRVNTGRPEKRLFAALKNGYHGESFAALSVGDLGLYSKPFDGFMPEALKIDPGPYISGPDSPLWEKFPDEKWAETEKILSRAAPRLTAVIFEPALQGAAGMRIYSPDFLRRLRSWADKNDVHLIADEIMTGCCRTGRFLACSHAGITADFCLLSKGLTSGWSPFSAVLAPERIYRAFYGGYRTGKAFLHSNTFTGHALGAAAALETLKIMVEEDTAATVRKRSAGLLARMRDCAEKTGCLANVRGLGFCAAADIVSPDTGKPFPPSERTGFEFFKKAVANGALLRPMGDVIYFHPPLNSSEKVLDETARVTIRSLKQLMRRDRGA
jgi:adenosylmethionine-8-amino-7-oxononanoate aminotransferase